MATKKEPFTRRVAPSFAKRLTLRPSDVNITSLPNARLVTTQELDENTGKILNKSVFKPVDRVSEMQNYSVNDFALENLLAVGAPLVPAMLKRDNLSSVDTISRSINSFEIPTDN